MPIPWRYLLFDDTYYLTKSITWRFFKLLDDTYFLTIPIIWRYLLLLCDVVRISEVSQPKLPLTMRRGVLRFLEPRSFCFTFCLVTADILSPAVSMHKSAWSLLQVTLSGTLRVRKRNQTAVKIIDCFNRSANVGPLYLFFFGTSWLLRLPCLVATWQALKGKLLQLSLQKFSSNVVMALEPTDTWSPLTWTDRRCVNRHVLTFLCI